MKLNMILAVDALGGFSKNGVIPWIQEPFAKEDLKRFKHLTMGSTCIMGRKTYEDIAKFTKTTNILPGRNCIVLSRNPNYYVSEDILVRSNIHQSIESSDLDTDIYFIGGLSIFKSALKFNLDTIHLTYIDRYYECDITLPLELILNKYQRNVYIESNIDDRVKYIELKKRDTDDKIREN